MDKKSLVKNILGVAISNCTVILSGIFIAFLVPKLMSVEGYGYYKSFTLYSTYIGLFSLGIIDGIVLEYGGKDYNELDRPLFRSLFQWYIIIHLFFSVILLTISFVFDLGEYRFIIIIIAVNMIVSNITGYYQQISQITQRFKEYSIRKILQSIANILVVFIVFVISKVTLNYVDYRIFVVLLVVSNTLLALWYCVTYRDIIRGKRVSLLESFSILKHLIICGIPLLVANLCSTLILTLDRQFVNILFDINDYAIYSFAYNMLSLITVAVSAVSTVLYPAMKRASKKRLVDQYSLLSSIVIVFVFFMTLLYYPLKSFIEWYLPKYVNSINIFRIIFPGLVMSSIVTVIMHNYYKVFGYNTLYFYKSLVVLGISGIANAMAYYYFHSMTSISWASIITMIFWYLFIQNTLSEKLGVRSVRNFVYLLTQCVIFYIITLFLNSWIGMIVHLVELIIMSYLFYKNSIFLFLKNRIKNKNNNTMLEE